MSTDTRRSDRSIDWDLARARLARIETGINAAFNPPPERAREIMESRARALARDPKSEAAPVSSLDVILFDLNGERYGIESRFVREVIRLADFTPVPGTPDFVLGVTNMRGVVLAVFDLSRLMLLPQQQGLTDLSRVIVLGTDRAEFGIVADYAHGQALVPADEIRGRHDGPGADYRALQQGVTGSGLVILDGDALLNDPRLIVDTASEPASWSGKE